MYIDALREIVLRNINFVAEKNLLDDDKLRKYDKTNVHSILQYCLLKVDELGLLGIPEFKIRLDKPIDKHAILEDYKGKTRNQWTIRVDVAYLKDSKVVGFGEVVTPDEIHGVPTPKKPKLPWIAPSHKIEHLAREIKPEFITLLQVTIKHPSWEDAKLYTLDEWEEHWKNFMRKTCEDNKIKCLHILMRSVKNIKSHTW
jgi:hypothetical protein